jgi:hypothetical protein
MEAVRRHEAYIHKESYNWAPVAHAYNPCFLRGRDQEDHRSMPAQANSSMRPYLEKPNHEKGLALWLKV